MARVKGSVLLDSVKAIRSDKSGRFDKYLTEQDREIISGIVLANTWYPLETYTNCLKAVFKELAKGDMQVVHEWGREFVDRTYKNVYKRLFEEGDPRSTIKNHELMWKTLFDSARMVVEEILENGFIASFKGFDPLFEPFYHSTTGTIERSLELAGGRDVEVQFLAKSWEGAPETRIKFSWSHWAAPSKAP